MRARQPFVLLLGAALLTFGWTGRAMAQVPQVPVADGLVIRGSTALKPGIYTVNDVSADGVIQIAADHVVLDGAGVVIQGTGFRGYAIRMNGHSGLTLRNFTIRGFDYGISIENAANVTIENNNVSGNRKDTRTSFLDIGCGGCYGGGILFRKVSGSRVRGNTLTDQSTGLEIIGGGRNTVVNNLFSAGPEGNETRQNSCWGLRLDGSTENLVRGNSADFVDRRRYGLDSGDSAGILLVAGAHRNRILGNSMTHSGDGFFLGNSCARESDGNYVYGNDGSFSPHNAFEATFSSGNVFDNNRANHSDYGFWLGYSHDSRVTRNEITGNASSGIAIEHGHGNEIDRNTMTRNSSGVQLWAADTTCPAPECGAKCPSASYRIQDNAITLNVVGLSLENTAGAAVSRNRVADNASINVRVTGRSTAIVLSNDDLSCHGGGPNSCGFALSNEMAAGLDVNASRNYWGTQNVAAIQTLIFDQQDNPTLGKVTFLPILKKPVPLASGLSDSGAWGSGSGWAP
jgi:parallel beta-helix repeat protein